MLENVPRYLIPFHPKQLQHQFVDVLIIGGGLAGLRAANAIPDDLTILVVTKDALRQSNSTYAQGGIASVLDPEDRFEDHVKDTIIAGGKLCDPKIVEHVVRQGPERIEELILWGANFDKVAGEIVLGREGGHSRRRIIHALGDSTGREVMRAVIKHTRERDNVSIWEQSFTLDLLTGDEGCCGAIVWREETGPVLVWAKQTILCTGGSGQVYRETTNPPVATGDGHALAYRAGAELRDMEFMQFHPTVLYIAGGSRSLITEAVRGEGAWLVDKNDYRFMVDYDERLELAPRDVVSQAIVSQMEKTRHGSVYLDMSHLDRKFVYERFPGIAEACAKFSIDIATDRIPVRPGAHYMIGGVTVDEEGRTTLPRLWAAGEVTSSGLHGANRLASNSLLEGLVYGASAGEGVAEAAAAMPDSFRALPIHHPRVPSTNVPLDIGDIRNSLKSTMWRSAGVRRDAESLREAADQVEQWAEYVLTRQFESYAGWELQNMLVAASMIIDGALAREESRGVHSRVDFPETNDVDFLRRISFQRS